MTVMAGKLRHRVELHYPVKVVNDFGEEEWGYALMARVWARVSPLSGSERLEAMELEAKVDHEVEIRYREGVTAQSRVVFGDRVFGVQAVINPDHRDRRLLLMCEEVA